MRRRRLHMSSTDTSGLRGTSGPRIDRFPPTRPSWRDRQFRELKKLLFSPPRKCPIDLFGPVANGTILKRLQVRFHASVLQAASLARINLAEPGVSELKHPAARAICATTLSGNATCDKSTASLATVWASCCTQLGLAERRRRRRSV